MQLVERGRIGLDDDVRPLVPELAAMQILQGFSQDGKPILVENARPITLGKHASATPSPFQPSRAALDRLLRAV